jgi:hypothetical protein
VTPARRDAKHQPRLQPQAPQSSGLGPGAIEQLGVQSPLGQEQVLRAVAVEVAAADDGGSRELQVLEEVDPLSAVQQDRGLAPVIAEAGPQRRQLGGRAAQGTAA